MKAKRPTQRKTAILKKVSNSSALTSDNVIAEVRDLVLITRQQLGQAVNIGLTMLHWQVGNRIHKEILIRYSIDE